MKRIIYTAACWIVTIAASAQGTSLLTYRQLNDSAIARYNRDDFKGIYALGNEFFKAGLSEDDCVGDFKEMKNNTGDIVATLLTDDLGSVKYFTWTGKLRNARFELRAEDNMVKQYRIEDFVMQPNAVLRQARTDNPLKTHLDSVVNKYAIIYMSDSQAVALSVGVYQDGVKHVYNYGEVKKGSGVLPKGNTIYQQGSIAKTFVGMLLAKAVVDKKVKLSDDVRKYLKGDYPNLAYQGHPITLQNLANHTGGFRKFNFIEYPKDVDNMPWNDLMKYLYAYPKERVIKDLHNLKVDTLPGVERNYSVGGFTIINMALETAYGKPVNELFKDYYGNILGMRNTKLYSDAADSNHFATPYNEKGEAVLPMQRSTPGLFTVKSTTSDMLTYIEANIKENDLGILLSHKPSWGNVKYFSVGLAWDVIDSWETGRWVFHSGHDAGYNSLCSMYPDAGLGFIFLQNENGRQGTLYTMERNIYQSLQGGH